MSHLQMNCLETVGVIDEALNHLQQDDPRLRLKDFLRLRWLTNNLYLRVDKIFKDCDKSLNLVAINFCWVLPWSSWPIRCGFLLYLSLNCQIKRNSEEIIHIKTGRGREGEVPGAAIQKALQLGQGPSAFRAPFRWTVWTGKSTCRGGLTFCSQVWCILFLFLLITSAWTCLQHSRNLGSSSLYTWIT